MPSVCELVTRTVFNRKTDQVENETSNVSGLIKKNYDAKLSDIEQKYFIISDYNKFTSDILDAKIKQKALIINLIFLISQKILT